MITVEFCPGCLTVLPDGYEFDHVAIDRALAGDTSVLAAMPPTERRELVLEGLRRGLREYEIAALMRRSFSEIKRWLTDTRPCRRDQLTAARDAAVRELHREGLSDNAIAKRLGIRKNAVFISRHRQGLPALFNSYGPIRREATAA